jgi:hypothetical protein
MEFGDGDDGGSLGASISCIKDTREELMDIDHFRIPKLPYN